MLGASKKKRGLAPSFLAPVVPINDVHFIDCSRLSEQLLLHGYSSKHSPICHSVSLVILVCFPCLSQGPVVSVVSKVSSVEKGMLVNGIGFSHHGLDPLSFDELSIPWLLGKVNR